VGLAQLERFPRYLKEYNHSLAAYNEAIADCVWLRSRTVPKYARQVGYIWACLWEGDKHGLSYDRFKQLASEEGLPLSYEFTERPAHAFPIFRKSTAYHHRDCPIRCPFYKGDYTPARSRTPVAAQVLKRVMMLGIIEVPPATVKANAAKLRRVIKRMEAES
jgi:dTDP-4-amino-4,6-dideoxygalactose transaminase